VSSADYAAISAIPEERKEILSPLKRYQPLAGSTKGHEDCGRIAAIYPMKK
jgi:hypothetical protein